MNDKQINKWLRRQCAPTGWVLLGYYALINLLCLIAMGWEALRQMRGLIGSGISWFQNMDMDALLSNAWGYIMAIVTVFLILHAWKGPRYWKNEVFAKESPMKAGVFFRVLCLCLGTQMVNGLWVTGLEFLYNLADKSLEPMMEAVSGMSNTFSMFLYVSVFAPLWEEILFRGFVLRTLRPFGKRFAVLGSAFLFGIFHGNLLQTPYAFLMGLLLGYVTVEYSIWWAIAVHAFNNFVLADLLTRITMLLPVEVAGLIDLILLGGGFVLSAVILIRKRHQIAEHIRSEWMDRRVLKCFFTSPGVLVMTVLMLINILTVMP